jgi:hypothetical protein
MLLHTLGWVFLMALGFASQLLVRSLMTLLLFQDIAVLYSVMALFEVIGKILGLPFTNVLYYMWLGLTLYVLLFSLAVPRRSL